MKAIAFKLTKWLSPPDEFAVRDAVAIFVCVASFMLLFQQGSVVTSDGQSMESVAHSLVTGHGLSVPAAQGSIGRDGQSYSKYGIGMTLIALPGALLGSVLGAIAGHADSIERFLVASGSPLLMALLAGALYLLCRRLGGSRRRSILVAIGAVGGTFLLEYGKDYFSEPLAALGMTVALERILARRPGWSGIFLGVAILARPQELLPAAGWIALVAVHRGRNETFRVAGGLLPAVLLTGAYDAYRFGSALATGYNGESFDTSPAGWVGLLLDPSKSLFLFAPILILVPRAMFGVWRAKPLAAHLLLLNAAMTFVLAAAWHSWEGGWSWGPRLLIPGFVPLIGCLGTGHGPSLRALRVAFAAGFAVSACTLLVPAQAQQLDVPPPAIGPSIWRQWELLPSTASYTVTHMLQSNSNPPGSHRRFLALWQVELTRQLGKFGLLLSVAGTVLLAFVQARSVARLGKLVRAPPN